MPGEAAELVVAQQGDDVGGLAGPVDPALGIDEGVERAGRDAAVDAAVGEVERGAGKVEEGEVIAVAGDDDAGRVAAGAAHQARIEAGMAVGIGDRGSQHRVVAGEKLEGDAGERFAVAERAHGDVEPRRAEPGREPDVGDDEPLGRPVRVVVVDPARVERRRGVDAGLQRADRGADRNRCPRRPVGRALDRHLALPDEFARGRLDVVHAPGIEIVEDQAVANLVDQRAVVDPVNAQGERVDVDGFDRQARGAQPRQHIAAAGEVDRGRAIGDGDGDRLVRRQPGAHGRQPGQQRDRVAGAVLQAVDADQVAPGADAGIDLGLDAHEGLDRCGTGEVDVVVEGETGARPVRVARHVDPLQQQGGGGGGPGHRAVGAGDAGHGDQKDQAEAQRGHGSPSKHWSASVARPAARHLFRP